MTQTIKHPSRTARLGTQPSLMRYTSWLAEARAIFRRKNERPHHLRLEWISIKLVQLAQPEGEARRVRITSQIADVFHVDKHAPEHALRVVRAVVRAVHVVGDVVAGGVRRRGTLLYGQDGRGGHRGQGKCCGWLASVHAGPHT